MKKFLLAVFALVVSIGSARSDELKQNITSTTAFVKIGETVEVTKQKEPVFRNVICNFSVTPGHSFPPSFILAGKVVDNNAGAPCEFVPVFFGSTLHLPCLAALTNVKGEFCFRVWASEKPDGKIFSRLQVASDNEAIFYLGGRFNERAEMLSSITHIHSLAVFLRNASKLKH